MCHVEQGDGLIAFAPAGFCARVGVGAFKRLIPQSIMTLIIIIHGHLLVTESVLALIHCCLM